MKTSQTTVSALTILLTSLWKHRLNHKSHISCMDTFSCVTFCRCSWRTYKNTVRSAVTLHINTVFICELLLMSSSLLLGHRRSVSCLKTFKHCGCRRGICTPALGAALRRPVWPPCKNLQTHMWILILYCMNGREPALPKHFSTSIGWCWCPIMNQLDLMQRYH